MSLYQYVSSQKIKSGIAGHQKRQSGNFHFDLCQSDVNPNREEAHII